MSIVKERIALRRGRREGEKTPHRIRFDAMASGDFLIVEVDVNKKSGLVYYYLFSPEQLSGRRAVTFRKSGDEIYWLSGLKPKALSSEQTEALLEQSGASKENVGKSSATEHGQAERNVLVFGAHDALVAVYRTLGDVAAVMNLRVGAIDKLCRTKRPSTETGYSFRYRKRKLDLDLTDFKLTLSRYDELCRRKPRMKD